jgi:hypothetical protein
MRQLVERLGKLGEDVLVLFDGKPFEIEAPPGVEVRFASRRGPNAADDDIAAFVESHPDPGSLRVVTSDFELARRVKAAGARVEPAGGFARQLEAL